MAGTNQLVKRINDPFEIQILRQFPERLRFRWLLPRPTARVSYQMPERIMNGKHYPSADHSFRAILLRCDKVIKLGEADDV
jgi:hypothetical protein